VRLISLAAISLNQTPLDWQGNLSRIAQGIEEARGKGAGILCFPELCLSGYGCEDAFKSHGVQEQAERCLLELVPLTEGLVCALGLPVSVRGVLYDAVCLLCDAAVLGFAVKHHLAGDGIHYEPRWFAPWPRGKREEIGINGHRYPIGDFVFEFDDLRLGFEICEDAWAGLRPGVDMAAQHVDIILNPSASHFAFGKFKVRKRFVLEGSRAFGVAYVYANMLGNEAGRAIYDGGSLIAEAGELVAVGPRFSYHDVSVTTAVVDLDQIRLKRPHSANPGSDSGHISFKYACLRSSYRVPFAPVRTRQSPPESFESSPSLKEEEFTRAVCLGLFDYLRKSRSKGFVVSLSGGADSTATACLCALMVSLAAQSLEVEGLKEKLSYIDAVKNAFSEREIVEALLTCVYQATDNSSETTLNAAKQVASDLGACFHAVSVQELVRRYTELASNMLGAELTWETHDLALQNIQARVRAPLVWLIANVKSALLLSTSNRSEAAVGYATMDGDTCGGLSPIAGIDKAFLLSWLSWLERGELCGGKKMAFLSSVTSQCPTAELRPPEQSQTDEADLMPYPVLDRIERAAIRDKFSPGEVLEALVMDFPETPRDQLQLWIRRFFTLWSRNQWKRERLAPCFHLDDENLDPKTWCRFPILSGGFSWELSQLDSFLDRSKP
jgi:NAD+ synthase (glutamine-hydrolysing)